MNRSLLPAPPPRPRAPGLAARSAGWLLLAALLALGLSVQLRFVSPLSFTYDEADYMYAVSRGFLPNALDRPSISVATFARLGLSKGRDLGQQRDLSSFIRSQDDITFFRHFHGPLYFYWQMLAANGPGPREHRARLASLVLLPLTCLAMWLGCCLLLEGGRDGKGSALAAGVLAVCLLGSCRPAILTAASVTPHALFALVSLAALTAMSRFLQHPSRGAVAVCACLTALAVATIEYAVLLVVTMAACLLLAGPEQTHEASLPGKPRLAWRFLLVLAISLPLIWPGSLLSLTVLKNYVFFAYFSVVRSQAAYGGQDNWWVWAHRLQASPLEYLAMALAFGLAARWVLARRHKWLSPFLIYALLLLATTLRNKSLSPTYLSSLFPALFMVAGLAWALALKTWRPAARALVTALVAVSVLGFNYFHGLDSHAEDRDSLVTHAVVTTYRNLHLAGRPMLVPQEFLPSLHYYFPQAPLDGYARREAAEGLAELALQRGSDGLITMEPRPELAEHGFTPLEPPAPAGGFHLYLRQAPEPSR